MKHSLIFGLCILFFTSCSQDSKQKQSIFEGTAMTVPYQIKVITTSKRDEKKAKQLTLDAFEYINSNFNHWNPSSLISKANSSPSGEKILITPELFNLLEVSYACSLLTKFRYDPTLGKWIKSMKNSLEKGQPFSKNSLKSLWDTADFEKEYLIKSSDDLYFDFDGIVKGFFLETLSSKLLMHGFENFCLNWGGDILSHGNNVSTKPWKISLPHKNSLEQDIILELKNCSISTSGTEEQQWLTTNGSTFSHIIVPSTGQPIEIASNHIKSVSVQSECAVFADALATAATTFESENELFEWIWEVKNCYPDIEFYVTYYSE